MSRLATIPVLLARRAATRGDHSFLICDDEVLTFAEAEARSAALAKALVGIGAGKGTHVGLLYPNGASFVVGWLAAARIGAVTLPLSTFSTPNELTGLIANADIEILLAATGHRGRDFAEVLSEVTPIGHRPILAPPVPSLRRVEIGTDVEVATALAAGDEPVSLELLAALEARVTTADRMVIVHTSGSTSAPKGVIHQQGSLLGHVAVLNEFRGFTEDDVHFANSPFFWIGGFAFSLVGALIAGATIVTSNAAAASDVLDLLERTRPTLVNGFAAAVAHLAKDPSFPGRDLTSIRRGNLWPILPADIKPADPELRHNMLGMTETASVCLMWPDESDQPEHRRGSFGKTVPGFESRIVDPDTGVECPTGATGELWLRGAGLMEGYYGRTRSETFTPDGWFRTGDLFHIDDEGFHFFHGRHGDMIKTAGANVAPREVEAAILDATGLVSHVVGIDDADRGQLVVAAVRLPVGESEPDHDELVRSLRERLSAYKVPKRFVFLADADVPMMSSGKLDARALKALLAASS